jgi:gluconolactonase
MSSGDLHCLVNTIPSPNGIVYVPKGNYLLVAVTRAQQIWRVPLHNKNIVGKVGVFSNLHGGLSGPDGLALDEEGSLYICHSNFGSVWRLSSQAEPQLRIRSNAGNSTTNLAFGGPEGKSLFITESETGSILRAEMPVRGLQMYSHAE